MTIRTFISAPLSNFIVDDLGRIRDIIHDFRDSLSVNRGFKVVKPDNLHITLKFLGEVDEGEIPRIKDVMKEAVRNIDPFEITVYGFNGLPRIEKPRIVYIQVHDEQKRLTDIYTTLNTKLGYIKKERKKYIPHITYIRIKHQKAWHELAERLRGLLDKQFGTEEITCIDLMASELKPSGPEYSILERVTLKNGMVE